MNLYIKIQDGKPIGHPYLEDNLIQCFGENIPAEYVPFKRVPAPALGIYEKNQSVSYDLVDGVYADVWSCEEVSAEERQQIDADIAADTAAALSAENNT